jgi:hypothetical protein
MVTVHQVLIPDLRILVGVWREVLHYKIVLVGEKENA